MPSKCESRVRPGTDFVALFQVLFGNPEGHRAGYCDDVVLADSTDQLVRGPRLERVVAGQQGGGYFFTGVRPILPIPA